MTHETPRQAAVASAPMHATRFGPHPNARRMPLADAVAEAARLDKLPGQRAAVFQLPDEKTFQGYRDGIGVNWSTAKHLDHSAEMGSIEAVVAEATQFGQPAYLVRLQTGEEKYIPVEHTLRERRLQWQPWSRRSGRPPPLARAAPPP